MGKYGAPSPPGAPCSRRDRAERRRWSVPGSNLPRAPLARLDDDGHGFGEDAGFIWGSALCASARRTRSGREGCRVLQAVTDPHKMQLKRMPDETPRPIYANVVQVTYGPFDIVLDFGFKSPERMRAGSAEYEIVARVAMSLSHAKSMLPLLARMIADYERKIGPITAPGFEEQSRE